MEKIIFDNEYYLQIQTEKIKERIAKFGDKLYLEFGGKLFDDFHASRVLPGFQIDSKLKVLLALKDKAEIIIVVNSDDINSNKVRNDSGITYEDEVMRLIDAYHEVGLYVSSVVLSFYKESTLISEFIRKLTKHNINVYRNYEITGYPHDISKVVSDDGLGKNEYIVTTMPLVVVTAPGPGSGKMSTCLSQLYHENRKGIKAGYAKYETFPVWNLPYDHPVNLAYEAATVDLDDVNMIDPYHLDAYGIKATNYNRDVESFPVLKEIFNKIYGKSPYNSPTDMGVNMVGFAIKDEQAVIEAAKDEIIRRYYQTLKNNFLAKYDDKCVLKAKMLMQKVNVSTNDRTCVKPCLDKASAENVPCAAMILNDGRVITGKQSGLLSASSAMILNAFKTLAKIDDSFNLISPQVIEPIVDLKINSLHHHTPRLRVEDILIALAIQKSTNPLAEQALKQIPKLMGVQAHSSVILNDYELSTLKKLGIVITEEPSAVAMHLYHK